MPNKETLATHQANLEAATRNLRAAQNNLTSAQGRLATAEKKYEAATIAINQAFHAVRTNNRVVPQDAR